jgi:hypothetical protein
LCQLRCKLRTESSARGLFGLCCSGVEEEVIDNSANGLAKNRVISFSGDTLIGPTIGRLKPYSALGAGDLHLNVAGLSLDHFNFWRATIGVVAKF